MADGNSRANAIRSTYILGGAWAAIPRSACNGALKLQLVTSGC